MQISTRDDSVPFRRHMLDRLVTNQAYVLVFEAVHHPLHVSVVHACGGCAISFFFPLSFLFYNLKVLASPLKID